MGGVLELAGVGARTADFDDSGTVDFEDFLQFAARFGEPALGPDAAIFDLDRDALIGFNDFLIFANQFGADAA